MVTAGHATKAEVNVQKDLATDDVGSLEAKPHLNEYGTDEGGDDRDGNRDVEGIDSDEEADFGYRDSENSEGEASNDKDDSDTEDDCI